MASIYPYPVFSGEYPLRVFKDGTYESLPIVVPQKCVPVGAEQSPAKVLFDHDCDVDNFPHPQVTGEGTGDIEVEECEVLEDE